MFVSLLYRWEKWGFERSFTPSHMCGNKRAQTGLQAFCSIGSILLGAIWLSPQMQSGVTHKDTRLPSWDPCAQIPPATSLWCANMSVWGQWLKCWCVNEVSGRLVLAFKSPCIFVITPEHLTASSHFRKKTRDFFFMWRTLLRALRKAHFKMWPADRTDQKNIPSSSNFSRKIMPVAWRTGRERKIQPL